MYDPTTLDTLHQRITTLSRLLNDAIAELQDAILETIDTQRAAIAALQSQPPALDTTHAVTEINRLSGLLAASIPGLAAAISGGLTPPPTPEPSGLPITPHPLSLSPPARAADVIDRLGVCTHNNYTDGQYANTAKVIEALRFLGLHHFRDTNFRPEDQGQQSLREVVAAGNAITAYVRSDASPLQSVSRLREFARIAPGALAMIEGFNEINNEPISYGGLTGEAAAQKYMEELYPLVRADILLADIPVAGFTNWPPSTSKCDVLTIHPYAKRGAQPRDTIEADLQAQRNAVAPDGSRPDGNKPFIITETGYHTTPTPQTSGWETVSEFVQAKLILNTYVDGLALGALRTFVYQLFDAYPGDGQEQHFGLFRLDFTPKPAATAIQNLTTILDDPSSEADLFVPTALPGLVVAGASSTGKSFLVQKSDGSYYVVVWAEPKIWDEALNMEIVCPITQQTVDFGRAFATVEIYDPLVGSNPMRTFTNAASVMVGVTDHPLIIRLSN